MENKFDIEKFDDSLSTRGLIKAINNKNDEISRFTALKKFIRKSPYCKNKIMQSVLKDSSQPDKSRYIAALELGHKNTVGNLKILVQSLSIQNDYIMRGVSIALGLIGNNHALKRLEKIKVRPSNLAYKNIQFAKYLIAYRHRINKYRFVVPSAKELVKINKHKETSIGFKVANPSLANKIVHQSRHELPALPISAKGAMEITCGSNNFLLFFTKAFDSKEKLSTMPAANAIPFVIMEKSESLGRYYHAYYIFAHPSRKKNTLSLVGTKTGGRLAYCGSIEIMDNDYLFSVKSVKSRSIAAVEINGSYNIKTRQFTFTKALNQIIIDLPSPVKKR